MTTVARSQLRVVTPPAVEPVSVDDVKDEFGITGAQDDARIARLITITRQLAESFTNRAFITQTLLLQLDGFPMPRVPWWDGVREGSIAQWASTTPITLPRPPLLGVTSVVWFDTTGAELTVDAASYFADTVTEPGRLVPIEAFAWPVTRARAGARITFTAGYGADPTAVPALVREAMLSHMRDVVERPNPAVSSEGIDNARVAYGGIRVGTAAGTGGPDNTMGLRADAANLLSALRVLEAGL